MDCYRAASAAACAAVLLSTLPAAATGFSTARFSGEHGHPTTTNPSAAYFNPAALTGAATRGNSLLLDGSLALRSFSFDHPRPEGGTPEPAGAEGANYGKGELFNVFGGPSVSFAHRPAADLVLAAGIFAPFAGSASFDKNEQFAGNAEFPGAVDGVARWHLIEGRQQSLYFTLAGAYQLGALSIGVSANLVHSNVSTVRARNASFTNDIPSEGRALLDVSGLHGSVGVGVMVELLPGQLWAGVSYQSQPGFGEMKLSGELTNYFGGFTEDTQAVDFYQSLPDQIRAGLRHRPSTALELRLHGEYSRWSAFDRQCITEAGARCAVTATGEQQPGTPTLANFIRRWQDAYQVRAGLSYFLGDGSVGADAAGADSAGAGSAGAGSAGAGSAAKRAPRGAPNDEPRLELFGGVGYDSNAVPDAYLEPALPDGDDLSLALGVRFPLGGSAVVAVSYTHLYYLPRDTIGKNELESFEGASKSPDAGAKYEHQVGILNANLEAMF